MVIEKCHFAWRRYVNPVKHVGVFRKVQQKLPCVIVVDSSAIRVAIKSDLYFSLFSFILWFLAVMQIAIQLMFLQMAAVNHVKVARIALQKQQALNGGIVAVFSVKDVG
jgi:hypothetical protein